MNRNSRWFQIFLSLPSMLVREPPNIWDPNSHHFGEESCLVLSGNTLSTLMNANPYSSPMLILEILVWVLNFESISTNKRAITSSDTCRLPGNPFICLNHVSSCKCYRRVEGINKNVLSWASFFAFSSHHIPFHQKTTSL